MEIGKGEKRRSENILMRQIRGRILEGRILKELFPFFILHKKKVHKNPSPLPIKEKDEEGRYFLLLFMWDAEWELLIFSINSSVWEIVEGVTAFHIERWGDKPKYARFFVAIFREVEVRVWTDFEFREKIVGKGIYFFA